jgi:hypothetical protein
MERIGKGDTAKGIEEALKLSDGVLDTSRARITTTQLIGRMGSASPTDKTICARIIMNLATKYTDSVVAAGVLPTLIGLLRPNDDESDKACSCAARAIWAISKTCKHKVCKHRSEIVRLGAVDALVHLLKKGSIHHRLLACRTLFQITHGLRESARDAANVAIAAGAAVPIVLLLRDGCGTLVSATDNLRERILKASASLICSLVGNSSRMCEAPQARRRCEAFRRANVIEPLMMLLNGSPNETGAYAAQALLDISADTPTLVSLLTVTFCRLLGSGQWKIDWFDVPRGLAVMAWRAKIIDLKFAEVAIAPLVEALVNGQRRFATEKSHINVMMGLGCIGSASAHVLAVIGPLAAAICVSEHNDVKVRIARTVAILTRRGHSSNTFSRKALQPSELLRLDSAVNNQLIPTLVQLLKQDTDTARKHAADCLGCIVNERVYIDAAVAIGAIEASVSIMHGQDQTDVKQYAAFVIGNIAFKTEHVRTMMKLGVIEPLMQLLQLSCDLYGGEFAAMAISNFTFDTECLDSMVQMGLVKLLVRIVYKDLTIRTSANPTCITLLREWRVCFTRAWSVVALLSITGSDKYHNNQMANSALEFFKKQLPNTSDDMKLELAQALLETTEKHMCKKRMLRNRTMIDLLDTLASEDSDVTIKQVQKTKQNLLAASSQSNCV